MMKIFINKKTNLDKFQIKIINIIK